MGQDPSVWPLMSEILLLEFQGKVSPGQRWVVPVSVCVRLLKKPLGANHGGPTLIT